MRMGDQSPRNSESCCMVPVQPCRMEPWKAVKKSRWTLVPLKGRASMVTSVPLLLPACSTRTTRRLLNFFSPESGVGNPDCGGAASGSQWTNERNDQAQERRGTDEL